MTADRPTSTPTDQVAARVRAAADAMEHARQQRDAAVVELIDQGLSLRAVTAAVGYWPRTTTPIVPTTTVRRIRDAAPGRSES